MNEGFSIQIFGDLNLEGMAIEINYNMEIITSITYEKGIDHMEIKMLPVKKNLIFSLDDFFHALEEAKKIALKCAKEDEARK